MKTAILERIVPVEIDGSTPRHLVPFVTAAQKLVSARHYDVLARSMHGPRLVAIAKGRGTLTEVKKKTGIAVPTLCRIQGGQTLVTLEQYVSLLKVCAERSGKRKR